MAGSTFPGRLGANSNPFGSTESQNAGAIHNVIEEDENDQVASPTTASFGFPKDAPTFGGTFGGSFGGDAAGDGPPSSFKGLKPDGFPSNYGMGRRTSVSAESLNPTAASNDNWTPPFHQKTPDQMSRLKTSISAHTLFSHLDDEQSAAIIGALVEKPIPAKDIKVITQGDQGDYFYIVETGNFDVFINDTGALQPGPNGMGTKVASIGQGGTFGELALMYGAPRNATIVSTEPGALWALDRVTFRRILMDASFGRRRMYEQFLSDVPLLADLNPYERSKISDALEPLKFPPGQNIITEGDVGDAFYLLEDGEAEAFKKGTDLPVKLYKKGDYFGELALLNDAPRAASVVTKTDVKVAKLDKNGFQRLLGPVEGIMRRAKYDTGVENVDPLQQ